LNNLATDAGHQDVLGILRAEHELLAERYDFTAKK